MAAEYTVVGYRAVDFVAADGKRVMGLNVWGSYTDDNISGIGVEKFWIRSEVVERVPELGDRVIPRYNKYGKVASLEYV